MTTPDTILLACRPVDLDENDELDRMVMESTFVYDGSVEGSCTACGRRIWIGPKAQAVLADRPTDAVLCCFMCAPALVVSEAPPGIPVLLTMGNLGNTQPDPRTR